MNSRLSTAMLHNQRQMSCHDPILRGEKSLFTDKKKIKKKEAKNNSNNVSSQAYDLFLTQKRKKKKKSIRSISINLFKNSTCQVMINLRVSFIILRKGSLLFYVSSLIIVYFIWFVLEEFPAFFNFLIPYSPSPICSRKFTNNYFLECAYYA